MNSIYQKNIRCLQTKHPQLANLVSNLKEIPALKLVESSSQSKELFCCFADGSEKPYYPSENSRQYSKKYSENLLLKNPRILIFLGMGLGHHLLEYARKSHPLNQVILIIESMPHLFKKALEVNDFVPMFEVPQVHWIIGQDLNQLKKFFNQFFSSGPWLRYANAVEFVEFPPSMQWNADYYSQAKEAFAQSTAHHFNRVFGDPYDAYRGTAHVLENLKHLIKMPALSQAKGLFQGKDGIIIASGPSLAKSLKFLKQAQEHAVIISCPSALALVISEGIHPHLWLNIERDQQDGEFLTQLPEKTPHVFVGPPHIHSSCFSGNGGLNTYLLGTSLQSRWLPLAGPILGLGHSSANAAFIILQLLGCSRIFLLGQDLCYDDQAGSHAAGVWKESQTIMMDLKKDEKKVLEVEGNNHKPVRSNLFWITFLKTFAEQLLPGYEGKVFNVIPEEYGAKINGCTRINPEDLLQTLSGEKLNTLDCLIEKLKAPSEQTQKETEKKLKQKLLDLQRTLKRLIQDNQAYAIKCRSLQFSSWFIVQNWKEGEQKYKDFLADSQRFAARFHEDPTYNEDLDAYHNFFYPIIQGLLLRGQIQYFSSSEDLNGNFEIISQKLETLFQMAKEEAFWAGVVLELISKY